MPKSGKKLKRVTKAPPVAGKSKIKANCDDRKRTIATRSRSVVATVAMDATQAPKPKRIRVAKQIKFDEIDGVASNNNAKPAKDVTKGQLQNLSDSLLMCDGVQVSVNEGEEEELDYYNDVGPDEDLSGSSMMDQGEDAPQSNSAQPEMNEIATDDLDTLMQDPRLRNVFNRMWDECVKEVQNKGESSGSMVLTTPVPNKGRGNNKPVKVISKQQKLPSDTTIYAPALSKNNRAPLIQQIGSPLNNVRNVSVTQPLDNGIAQFLEIVRAQTADGLASDEPPP